jgi:hypothetical protein
VAYLSCSKCGLTLFDRNPLTSPRDCPRCFGRGVSVELDRVPRAQGRAAASVLRGNELKPVQRAE